MSQPRTFAIHVPEDVEPSDILARARDAAKRSGIEIAGDDTAGRFTGAAEGTYRVDGDARLLSIEVVRKPAFVPWSMVESGLRKAFR
jgi:hypothetical protein